MFLAIIFLLIGLTVLIFSANYLVSGSSSLSKKTGVPPIIIGLTVVAFGTSAPELIVSIISAFKGSTDIAIGNIIGSNIANILLIAGISAIVANIKIKKTTIWREMPLALLAVMLVFMLGIDNSLSRSDGLILIGFFLAFFCYTARMAMKGVSSADKNDNDGIKIYSYKISFLMTIGGLVGLFFGGNVLVENAVKIAKCAGLSEMFIGLTIVAIGTSLPEMATSIMAVCKKQDDIAIGNVIGSNIFNIFWILGLTSILKPIPINEKAIADILVCLAVTLSLFVFMFIGKKYELKRWQGIFFVSSYALYLAYLISRG